MKTEQFTAKSPGKLVSLPKGTGPSHAFVPEPLPPTKWIWPNELWPLLLEARTALAGLNGIGRHLPDPSLILRPLQFREAIRSSNLEGTFTDPEQQALFELAPSIPNSREDPANARREVFNYGEALKLWRERQDSLPLSLRLIRELHKTLMTGVRGADKNPGEFRRLQNQIRIPARYVPPPVQEMTEALNVFEKYLHSEKSFDPLVEAFLVHYQFEAIHPFMDGNGRVGRLLLSIVIQEWCGLSDQWLYMSAYFDANKDEYMDRLFQVSTKADWRSWIEFCLRGVIAQAKDTEERCNKLLSLRDDFVQRVHKIGGNARLLAIIDDLFRAPVTRVTWEKSRRKVTYPTANNDLERLMSVGILTPAPGFTQKTYFCNQILEVIHVD